MNITQTKNGGWYVIEQDSHHKGWIEENGLDHDKFLIPIIESIIQPGWICIDAGALYGDHSISYCRSVCKNGNKDGAVIAIEANPLAFECLSKNAERFEGTVVLINACLQEQHGTTAVHIMEEGTAVNVGASQVMAYGQDKAKTVEREIKTISLDGLVMDANLTNGFQFLKIDCEGHELSILKGGKSCLRKFKPVMLIEINHGALQAQGATDKEIYDLLLDLGFEWRIVQPDCNGSSPQFDILVWPNPVAKVGLVKVEKL